MSITAFILGTLFAFWAGYQVCRSGTISREHKLRVSIENVAETIGDQIGRKVILAYTREDPPYWVALILDARTEKAAFSVGGSNLQTIVAVIQQREGSRQKSNLADEYTDTVDAERLSSN